MMRRPQCLVFEGFSRIVGIFPTYTARCAAKEVAHFKGLVWLIVGDRAKIKDQIKAADIAPIEFWTAEGQPKS